MSSGFDEMKEKLTPSIFPIEGLSEVLFKFRILKVRENIPQDNKLPIRLQKWADELWKKHLKIPVFPTQRFNYPAFIVPDDQILKNKKSIEIRDVPDKTYHIDLLKDVLEINVEKTSVNERALICKMLERPFTEKLWSMRNIFWKDQWNLFYFQKPINLEVNKDSVNAYRGYKFAVVYMEDLGFFLAIDVRTRYVGRKSISDYSLEHKDLVDHLNLESVFKERPRFLRDNGFMKYPCKYSGFTDQSVSEYYINDNETVYNYYSNNYPQIKLDPNDDVVFAQYNESNDSLPIPSSRMFPIFNNDYEGVRKCSIKAQLSPNKRYSSIKKFLKYLTNIEYSGKEIKISKNIFTTNRTVFIPPNLEFGASKKLKIFEIKKLSINDEKFDKAVLNWRNKKIEFLYENGPFHNEPLPGIVFIYPESLERSIREKFLAKLESEIEKLTDKKLIILKQIPYKISDEEKMGSSLIKSISEFKNSERSIYLPVLWKKHYKNVYGNLKIELNPKLSQCAWEKTIRNISENESNFSKSQLRNLALGILIECGTKPWVIAEDLHHDLHIGIDLLYGHINYNFLYGKGGRFIKTETGSSISRGRYHEAIKKTPLSNQIISNIKSIKNEGHEIKNLIIHRDGRWWKSESEGLEYAIAHLKDEDIIPKETKYAIVEIRKSHLPIRIFSSRFKERKISLRNPLIGTYLKLDSNNILLTTTGTKAWDDFNRGRSANTLLLKVVEKEGNLNIEEIAEDAYNLTHLNWNSPDIDISLPVTITWADQALREKLSNI